MGGAPPTANGCGREGERGLAKGEKREKSRRGTERAESGWGGRRSEDSQAVEQVKAKTT